MTNASFSELRLESVGRSFGEQEALAGLDLTIRSGEFIALLGPSGCGKSTALNCLAGLLPLTAGSIWMDSRRIDTLPPEKRGFGMVFQNYALFPHLTVRKNIDFGLQMRHLPKADVARRSTEAVRLVHLEEHAGKLPGQLSGGQQQRVAIARAVVLEPSLVLMDEPLSNLDAKLRLEMRTEIRRLHQSLGLTTVYVTHDQEEALSMADRLVVLRAGRVQQIGTPAELHTQPVNWHVADFMGFRNLFPATVVNGGRGVLGDEVVVDVDGLRLVGAAAAPITVGEKAAVGIRPEDLQIIAPNDPGTTAGNVIRAKVSVVEYQGREFAVEVRTATGIRLHLRTPIRLDAGDVVDLRVPAERLLVFPGGNDLPVEEAPLGETASADGRLLREAS
ncbi:MAG: putative spermidine/putrescine transport system ATP-binding protein [Actinomycetota bacterium]|nr:putative spermidine/putrescine transport system ATP-binding protein [Actinomycetota bacterium]